MTAAEAAAIAIVRDFCAAFDRLDWDAIFAAVTDDIIYDNVPMPTCHGIAEFKAFFAAFPLTSARFEIHHIAAAGPVVLTERTDHLDGPGGAIVIRVMGACEIRDGKIAAWRDYFDLAQAMPKPAA